MNMLAGMMGGLIDKEQITRDTLTDSLLALAEEYQCEPTDLFIMIKPTNKEDVDFKCWIYKVENGNPTLKREITLKEILDGEKST
jgi:hypothetical protein